MVGKLKQKGEKIEELPMPSCEKAIAITLQLGFLQVKAQRVVVGPQPYALAVIGAFTGVLASAANPINGAAAASSNGTCQIVVATITDGPTGLTNLS